MVGNTQIQRGNSNNILLQNPSNNSIDGDDGKA